MKRPVCRCLLVFSVIVLAGAVSAADFSSWQRKMPITFAGYNPPGGATTLTNFPALVVLSTNISQFNYADFLSLTNQDLRFTDSTGTNELNYEIESWNTNGTSYVWLQVTNLVDTNTAVWAYWGKSGEDTPPSCRTNGAVWDATFRGVWHMQQTNAVDATTNANHATPLGNVAVGTTSVVGRALQLDGTGDYLRVPHHASIAMVNDFTAEVWFKRDADGVFDGFLSKLSDTYTKGWNLNFENTQNKFAAYIPSAYRYCDGAVRTTDYAWHHFVLRMTGTTVNLFLDGVQQTYNTAATITDSGKYLLFGRFDADVNDHYLQGSLDEIRLSAVPRSSNWVWACHRNVTSNGVFAGSFNTYGAVQTVATDLPLIENGGHGNLTDTSADVAGTLVANGSSAATVYLYWSTADGTTNASDWTTGGFVTNLGARADGATFTNTLTGLASNTTYYWNHSASNATGTAWAATAISPSFKTLGPPAVDNGVGATAINSRFATLNGTLTDGTSARVWVFWWTNGAPTTNSYDFGTLTEGAFSNTVTGLSVSTPYSYRCYASNVYGESWATVSNFTTIANANTWDGETGDGNWGTAANWEDNTVPASGASVTFPDVANQTVNLGANRSIVTLTFDAADDYTLNNNTLANFGANSYLVQSNSGSVTINSAISLGSSHRCYIQGPGTGTVTVNRAISGSSSILYLSLTNGVVTLAGPNTYSGNTYPSAGTVIVSGTNTSGGEFRPTGGTFVLASDSAMPFGTGNWHLLGSLGFRTPDTNTRTVANGIGGNATGNFTLTFDGPGNLVFNGAFSPIWNVAGHRYLNVSVPRLILNGGVSADNSNILFKDGTGTLVMASNNNTYKMSTSVRAGALLVNGIIGYQALNVTVENGGSLGGTGSVVRAVTVQSGATLSPGDGGVGTLTVSNLTMQAGAIYDWEFGGGQYDRCDVLNTLSLGTSAKLRVIDLGTGGPRLQRDSEYVLFSYQGAHPTLPSTWTFEFVGDRWGGTNAVVTLDTGTKTVLLSNISTVTPGTVINFQ